VIRLPQPGMRTRRGLAAQFTMRLKNVSFHRLRILKLQIFQTIRITLYVFLYCQIESKIMQHRFIETESLFPILTYPGTKTVFFRCLFLHQYFSLKATPKECCFRLSNVFEVRCASQDPRGVSMTVSWRLPRANFSTAPLPPHVSQDASCVASHAVSLAQRLSRDGLFTAPLSGECHD
jgi:hypothetical protein